MRFFKMFLAFTIAFNLTSCADKETTGKEAGTDKEELNETINKFNKAFREGNVTEIESMITENYLHTNGNSKSIRKKDWLNYLNKRKKDIESGNLEVIDYEMDETEIELHDNVAIVTGRIVVTNKNKKGIKKNEYRITNIWVNESGSWKRAGFHDGKIK